MRRVSHFFGRAIPASFSAFTGKRALLPFIALTYLIGILAGSFIGVYSDEFPALLSAATLLSAAGTSHRLLPEIFRNARCFLLLALFSTSFLGTFFTLLLCACAGFSFSCLISEAFCRGGFDGLLTELFRTAVPVLIGLPAFLLVCLRSGRASLRLLPNVQPLIRERDERYSVLIFPAVLLTVLLTTLYDLLLLPRLLICCG